MSGFDFSQHMDALCRDLVLRLPDYAHIDMERVGVGFRQTRQASLYGVYATLTPLRFAQGNLTLRRRGRDWTIQRVYRRDGQELLYLLNFFLPRFLDLPFREKLITVCHELWHIGASFDGDLRRHAGRCFAHGRSREKYDENMERFVDDYLRLHPPESLYAFLQHDTRQLVLQHGTIVGRRWPRPKLIPIRSADLK